MSNQQPQEPIKAAKGRRERRNGETYRTETDELFEKVGQKLVSGGAIRGYREEGAAMDLAAQAARVLYASGGSATWVGEVGLAALKWAGVDPQNPGTWPFEIPEELMPSQGLAGKLTGPAGPGREHIITTFVTGRRCHSSAVKVREDMSCDVELPRVLSALENAVSGGATGSVILRTFDHSRTYTAQSGAEIPYKTVRSWYFHDGMFEAMTAAETFDAACTDTATGELLSPEPAVDYADAWEITLT
ncbi:hypothetical protein [Arthrobacter mobilis]|uniref:Uncharacterized protein n=1 Tax=Arthrobacter mobilis TaxID=2724944 RepID=A0A7X6HEP8_9MICC|nr:hypothetical protein [Arthrobacter mobilis]NKX55797.1 hypothetical protein [Arthrobacter mobilis]